MLNYKLILIFSIICMFIAAIVNAANIYTIKIATDFIFANSTNSHMGSITNVIIFLFSVKMIVEYYQSYLIKLLGFKVVNKIQNQFYHACLNMNYIEIKQSRSGDLLSRFSNDMQVIKNGLVVIFLGLARHILSISFLIVTMFYMNKKFAIIALLIFPAIFIPVKFISRYVRYYTFEMQKNLSQYIGRLKNLINNANIVKTYSTSSYEITKANKYRFQSLNIYKKIIKLDSLIPAFLELLSGFIILMILWYGKNEIESGNATLGDLVGFIAAFTSFYKPLKSLLSFNSGIQDCISSATRIFEIIDQKNYSSINAKETKDYNNFDSDVVKNNTKSIINSEEELNINIEDNLSNKMQSLNSITSKLKNNKLDLDLKNIKIKNIIFKNINLTINENIILNNINYILKDDFNVITGKSGSGKSSILKILTKLYNLTSGDIIFEFTTKITEENYQNVNYEDVQDDANNKNMQNNDNGNSIKEYLKEDLKEMSNCKLKKESANLNKISINLLSQDKINELIAYVPQEASIIVGDIFDNIAYGAYEIDKERAIKCIKAACLTNFIDSLPEKYESEIHLIDISFGQKQRIAIARALYKNTQIIMLDEATSCLDSKTEDEIIANILNMNKKIIIVSHRKEILDKSNTKLIISA